MTIAPFDPGAIARFGLSDARTAWKACGQSLWALLAGVLLGGEAITGGSFHGYTLACEVVGDQNLEAGIRTGIKHKFLRSDATLTVNIPKGSGAGSLQVTMNNFQRWNEESEVWTAYVDNFAVALNGAAIGDSGTFSGLQRWRRRRLQREFLGASRRRGRT